MTPEDREAKLTQLLCGMTNRGKDDLCFADTGFTSCDTEHTYRWHRVLCRKHWGCRMDRKVGTDRNEGSMRRDGGQPGKLFRRDCKDREIDESERMTHGADLGEAPNGIDQTGTRVWLNIMKDDAYPSTGGLQDFQRGEYSLRKTPSRPGQRCVLQHHPRVAPLRSLKPQLTERLWPTMNFPGYSADLHLNITRLEGRGEITAVFPDGVGRHVLATK